MSLDVSRYCEVLERVADLQRREDFDGALRAIDELLAHNPHSSALLVHRAIFLQLSPTDGPLEDVEQALQLACTFDDTNIKARLEMGHFLDAARDRPREALEQFIAASNLAAKNLKDALLGRARCLIQLDQRGAAEDVLCEAERCFPDDTDVALLRANLEAPSD
jgi:tetratricopeptide (TPR) repeat protein